MASFSQSKEAVEPSPVTNPVTDVIEAPPVLMRNHNTLLSVIGAFENDPEYDALMEDVYEYRRQLDARESQDAG